MLVFCPAMLVLGLGFQASFVGLGMFGLGLGRPGQLQCQNYGNNDL